MAWIVPADLEEVVYGATRAALGDAALATSGLIKAIVDRSRRYTSERDRPPSDRIADLAARALFFTIADAIKIAIPLGELASRGAVPRGRPLRIVDLGAGCGAMSLGALSSLGESVELTLIDRDAGALAIARDAVRQLADRRGVIASVATRVDDVTAARLPPADLVVIGTLLNELAPAARFELVRRALAAIGDDGAVIIVEPALRDTARALHELRDATVAAGLGHVFAPCARQGPCPALLDPRDWCHEDRPAQLPPRTAELARLTHLRDGGLKFAYLVLRRAPLGLVDHPALPSGSAASPAGARLVGDATAWRVVSAPMSAKGKLELIGCSAAGRLPLRLLRRHRAAHNRGFEAAQRGDVLIIDAAAGPDRVEIEGETRVERIEPARDQSG